MKYLFFLYRFLALWVKKTSRWILGFSILFFGFGLIVFPIMIGRLPRPNGSEKTDAIVIFTGELEREKIALKLYHQGLARKIHISGRYIGFRHKKSIPGVTFDFAQTTQENIMLTKQWLHQNHIRSVRLVTSDYHMPRCLLLAKTFWPDMRLIPHPVPVLLSKKRHVMLTLLAEYFRYVRTALLCWAEKCFFY